MIMSLHGISYNAWLSITVRRNYRISIVHCDTVFVLYIVRNIGFELQFLAKYVK